MDTQSKINANPVIEFLNSIPLGSIIAVIGAIGALVALILGDIDYLEFAASLGLSGLGGGAIGTARNGAGKGVRTGTKRVGK